MKITKKEIINISLIILMVISFSIFTVYEIKNKGKVENALPQQDMTVADATINRKRRRTWMNYSRNYSNYRI